MSGGMAGAAGTDGLSASCLSPCHGFTGIVEQWKTSRHFSAYVANLDSDEVTTWTGATACGNCHAIDGIEQRLAGNVTYRGTTGATHVTQGQLNYKSSINSAFSEVTYAGHASVAVVHCTTCHSVDDMTDPHRTGADFTPGSFPLRVPAGATDLAFIEKSSAVGTSDGTGASFGNGNACIWCHKSRKDVTNYVVPSNNINQRWGPHQGPHADVFTGRGGYHYAGKQYSRGTHPRSIENGCVGCHMPAKAGNMGIGDHSFKPQLSACVDCHGNQTSFDINAGQSQTSLDLQKLRVLLNDAGLLSRDGSTGLDSAALDDRSFASDVPRASTGVSAALAGALYNYLIIARGGALGVHNPPYVGQLIYDSIEGAGGDVTTVARPPYTPD